MGNKISVFGSINMDQVARVDSFPRPGETIKGRNFAKVPGGKGANQAVAASRLGGEVSMFGLVGQDVFGDELVSNLEAEGVMTDFVEKRPGSTGLALIQVDSTGENQIVIIPGANGEVNEQYVNTSLEAIMETEVLLLQLEIPFEVTRYLLKRLSAERDSAPRVVLDPAPARKLGELDLSAVDYIVPNEGEVEQLLPGDKIKDIKTNLLHRGVKAIVITRGDEGASFVSEEDHFELPGFSVDVEDTTAAGDAFAGALAVGLARGSEMKDIIEFANAAGGLTAAGSGAQPSLPDRGQVMKFLEEKNTGNGLIGGEG